MEDIEDFNETLKGDKTYPMICSQGHNSIPKQNVVELIDEQAPPEVWQEIIEITNLGVVDNLTQDPVFALFHPEFAKLLDKKDQDLSPTLMGYDWKLLHYWIDTQKMKYVSGNFKTKVSANGGNHPTIAMLSAKERSENYHRIVKSVGINSRFAVTLVGFVNKSKENEMVPGIMPVGHCCFIPVDILDVISARDTSDATCRNPKWLNYAGQPTFYNIVKAALSKTDNLMVVLTLSDDNSGCLDMHICTLWTAQGLKVLKVVKIPPGMPTSILIYNRHIFLSYSSTETDTVRGSSSGVYVMHYDCGVFDHIFYGDVFSLEEWTDKNLHSAEKFNVVLGLENQSFYRHPIDFCPNTYDPASLAPVYLERVLPTVSQWGNAEDQTERKPTRIVRKSGSNHFKDFRIIAASEDKLFVQRNCALKPEISTLHCNPTHVKFIDVKTFGDIFCAYLENNYVLIGDLTNGKILTEINTKEFTDNLPVQEFYNAIHINSERCNILLNTGDLMMICLERGVANNIHRQPGL